MQMPNIGDVVTVRATAPNVEIHPCSRRFLDMAQEYSAKVTPYVASRLRDGALILIPPALPAAATEGNGK